MQKYLRKRRLLNTQRSNRTGLKVFSRFVIDYYYIERLVRTEPYLRSEILKNHAINLQFCITELRKVVFRNCDPNEDVLVESRIRIRPFLI